MRRASSAFCVAVAASTMSACATPTTTIDERGDGLYVSTARSGYFPRRSPELRVDAEQRALAFCGDRHRALSVLDVRVVDPDPPAYSSATIQFRCVPI